MNLKELVESVSGSTGIAAASVKRVLDATISAVNKEMEGEEPIKLQGLGTFVRRAGKEDGTTRIVFRPWLTKDQRQAKKEKKKTKKAEATAG